jgi:LuxR family transcriptional regulator, maltose regulon positive regulatory protein
VVSEIERRRLLRLLEATATPVVVVSAPAGSGKSVLARQWTGRGSRRHTTVQVAAYMDDPAILSEAVLDALETLGPAAPQTRARMTGKEPAFSSIVLPALTRLVGTRDAPFVLVIDDVHLLRSPGAHQVLEAVCEACPEGSTVVILTRSQPPDWLARVRATGRLTEVSVADLDFDLDETTQLLSAM